MTGPTLEELRELSQRSRRAHGWGILAILGTLLLLPLSVLLAGFVPQAWLAYGATLVGGGLFVAYGYQAGKERGAFRRVFRRVKEEHRLRVLVPEAPGAQASAAAPMPVAQREG